MNLNKLNNWLTLIANIGVLIGIIVVVVELRQNTTAIEYDSYWNRVAAAADLRIPLIESDELARKYLEYAALGAPGVFSALDPYMDVVRNGENGLLAADLNAWDNQLSRLIEDTELRTQIALQAQADVRRNWLLSQHAQQ